MTLLQFRPVDGRLDEILSMLMHSREVASHPSLSYAIRLVSEEIIVNILNYAYPQQAEGYLTLCLWDEDGEITSFGHGRSYRIPYKNSIGDRLPGVLQTNSDIIDFSDAVFGRKEDWAGRVSFEDAHLMAPAKSGSKAQIKPLLGANPTSYQLYLTQQDWPPAHWDSDAPVELRGYKMYWHKNIGTNDWQLRNNSKNQKIIKQIEPLLAGNAFSSAIHFRNLTAVELGPC